MLVEINDNKFRNAKQGDLFVIEVSNGKKYATPISKAEYMQEEKNTIQNLQEQINDLKKELLVQYEAINKLITTQNTVIKKHMDLQNEAMKNQTKKIDKYSKSIYEFIDIMKGETTNE